MMMEDDNNDGDPLQPQSGSTSVQKLEHQHHDQNRSNYKQKLIEMTKHRSKKKLSELKPTVIGPIFELSTVTDDHSRSILASCTAMIINSPFPVKCLASKESNLDDESTTKVVKPSTPDQHPDIPEDVVSKLLISIHGSENRVHALDQFIINNPNIMNNYTKQSLKKYTKAPFVKRKVVVVDSIDVAGGSDGGAVGGVNQSKKLWMVTPEMILKYSLQHLKQPN
eukprot:TRINITY_DN6555_c0_g1_i2.p1 TRINITY_DN6555_c0_g1~~TRINITY_DN6555_c0_g1_i2.p1  ORF type:complete len:224 (-),score=48.69 TRINITY_DN6555_c0_g1_i2:132-803(-)